LDIVCRFVDQLKNNRMVVIGMVPYPTILLFYGTSRVGMVQYHTIHLEVHTITLARWLRDAVAWWRV